MASSVEFHQRMERLNTALQELPVDREGSGEQNRAVQRAAQAALAELNRLDYTTIPLGGETQEAINRVVTAYNQIRGGGGFDRRFFRSQTQESVVSLFEYYQRMNNTKHRIPGREREAYAEVRIGRGRSGIDRRITVTFHNQQQTIAETVQDVAQGVVEGVTRAFRGGPEEIDRISWVRRIWAAGRSGSMHEHYESKVIALREKVAALAREAEAIAAPENTNKRRLTNLICALNEASRELEGLRDPGTWRAVKDIETNEESLGAIEGNISTARGRCFEVVSKEMQSHPGSYKTRCSTGWFNKRYFEAAFNELLVGIGGYDRLRVNAGVRLEYFTDVLGVLRLEGSSQEVVDEQLTDAYLRDRSHASGVEVDDPYREFKEEVKASAWRRLEQRVLFVFAEKSDVILREGLDARLRNNSLSLEGIPFEERENFQSFLAWLTDSLDDELETRLQLFVDSNPSMPEEDISRLLEDIIAESVHRCSLAKVQNVGKEYTSIQAILSRVGEREAAAFSQEELDTLIGAVQIFSLPNEEVEETETVDIRLARIGRSVEGLATLREKENLSDRHRALIIRWKGDLGRYRTGLWDQERRNSLQEEKVSEEVGRRHRAMLHHFSVAVRESQAANEKELFMAELQKLEIDDRVPRDLLAEEVDNEAIHFPEMEVWREWIQQQPGARTEHQGQWPGLVLQSMASGSRLRKLRRDFQSEIDRRLTPYGVVNFLIGEGRGDEEIVTELQGLPLSYGRVQAEQIVGALRGIREDNEAEIKDHRSFLEDRFQYTTEEPDTGRRRIIHRDLRDWQMRKYLTATGCLSPRELESIINLNMTKEELKRGQVDRGGSLYISPEKRWRRIRKAPTRDERSVNGLGTNIMRLQERRRVLFDNKPIRNRDLRAWVALLQEYSDGISRLSSDRDKRGLREELDRHIIASFRQMSRFRLQCSDTQWDTFCEEVAFGRLQALAGSCTFNTEEFVHIGREIEGLVLRSEQAFDELQGRIAQGEVISSREIDETTRGYVRALRVFQTEKAVISRYLVEELSEEARPTRRVFNSRDELFDTAAVVLRREEEGETIQEAEERVRNVYRDHRTLCGVYHSRLEHSVGSVISGIRRIQIPGRELLEEDATDEEIFNGLDRSLNRDIAIATDRGILHNLDLLCAEIEHHSDRTPIQEQQRDLEAYSTLLEEAIRVFGDREETLQVAVEQMRGEERRSDVLANGVWAAHGGQQGNTYVGITTRLLQQRLQEVQSSLAELSAPTEATYSRVQQNIAVGMRQRALELLIRRSDRELFDEDIDRAENRFILSILSRASMQQAVEQGEASAHEDPAQRDVIWKEWARREYETVALPSTPPLPDLETHTEEDVVTFLSEVSGKDIAVLYQELRDTINRYPSRIVSEHLTQMLSNTGNWRALPEYVDWAAWVNAEYEKLSVLSPGPLPDLEENSVDQVLTFLSEAFGRDPETYKGVLFQRFKSAVLARDGGMISPETMERTRLLSREIDSIFWGDGWAKWANERCTTSMRRVRLGAQEAWIRGGIRYFEEINRFRGGDTDRRRRDFIIKQIIPAFSKYGVDLTYEEGENLMEEMIAAQGALASDVVADLPGRDLPEELKSILGGDRWKAWVRARCTAPGGMPRYGARETEWGALGVQCLDDIDNFRADSSRGTRSGIKRRGQIRQEFIDREMIPYLRRTGSSGTQEELREEASDRINSEVADQRGAYLRSIKGKIEGFHNQGRDTMLPAELVRTVVTYFRRLGFSNFSSRDAQEFLVGMQEYRTSARQLLAFKRDPTEEEMLAAREDLRRDLAELATSEGHVNVDKAQELGLAPGHIQVLEAREDLRRDFEELVTEDGVNADKAQELEFVPEQIQALEDSHAARNARLAGEDELRGDLAELVTEDGVNVTKAQELGFTQEQIVAFQAAYVSTGSIEEQLQRESVAVGSWDGAANRVCQYQLRNLDEALFSQVV